MISVLVAWLVENASRPNLRPSDVIYLHMLLIPCRHSFVCHVVFELLILHRAPATLVANLMSEPKLSGKI